MSESELASFPITILPSGTNLSCRSDETLLDSCINAGIGVPYNCRSGECGECLASLVSGTTRELPGADPAIFNDAHRARGDILMCMCFPRSSIVLNVPIGAVENVIRPSTFNVTVSRVERLCATVYGVTVEAPQHIEFHAGQNFQWIVQGVTPNRTYSAANRPGTGAIDFHVRVYPGGKIGAFVSRMSVGQSFEMMGPFGNFALSGNEWRPCVLVAGGTGLAPIVSVLDEAFSKGNRRPTTLYYGTRSQADLYCLDLLRNWSNRFPSFRFVPVLSHEPSDSDWMGSRGMVTDALAPSLVDAFGLEAYVCGPPAMIDATLGLLESAGIPPEDIRTDRFVQVKNSP